MSLIDKIRHNKLETLFVLTIAVVLLLILRKGMKTTETKNVILLGGLDTRSGDKKIDEQIKLVKSGLSKPYTIEGYRYKDVSSVLQALEKNPNSIVLCFSAGCLYSQKVAEKMAELKVNLNNLYIIEPYNAGGETTKSVKKAVQLGVPEKNVYVGTYKEAGLGIVANPTPTPSCSPKHWCALTQVAKTL